MYSTLHYLLFSERTLFFQFQSATVKNFLFHYYTESKFQTPVFWASTLPKIISALCI